MMDGKVSLIGWAPRCASALFSKPENPFAVWGFSRKWTGETTAIQARRPADISPGSPVSEDLVAQLDRTAPFSTHAVATNSDDRWKRQIVSVGIRIVGEGNHSRCVNAVEIGNKREER